MYFRQCEKNSFNFSYIASSAVVSFPQSRISTPALCLLTFFLISSHILSLHRQLNFHSEGEGDGIGDIEDPSGPAAEADN